jgi:hypothetical protein
MNRVSSEQWRNAMTVESSLLFAILSAETVLFGMLVWKHVYVVLPVFTVSGILLCSTGFVGTVLGLAWPSSFASFFLVDIFVRAAFLLCTVAEIARNLIRWNRATSPFIPLYLALLVVTSSLLLLLAQWSSPAGFSPTQKLSAHALQLVGAVQIAAFLALAWWALLRPGRSSIWQQALAFSPLSAWSPVCCLPISPFTGTASSCGCRNWPICLC